jgi:2-pyrone-4,6-dicarboxylate lactonase
MLSAVSRSGGALRAIAVAGPEIADNVLAAWRDKGVCGLRFVETRTPDGGRYPGSVSFDALETLAPRLRALGLHAQLWAPAAVLAEWLPRLLRLKLPLVLDHMGSPDPDAGVRDPAFQAVLAALSEGSVWVKLTACRIGGGGPRYERAHPFHDALLTERPDRLVWGSDWPFVRLDPAPDAGRLMDLLALWTPDIGLRTRVLVDNPNTLYGFE